MVAIIVLASIASCYEAAMTQTLLCRGPVDVPVLRVLSLPGAVCTCRVSARPWPEGGQRTFFLVNTVPLVAQQAKAIEQHTDLTVGQFTGSATLDAWIKRDWEVHLEQNQVRPARRRAVPHWRCSSQGQCASDTDPWTVMLPILLGLICLLKKHSSRSSAVRCVSVVSVRQVLVMSSQIFCNMLLHGFLDVSRVNLVIMDECHHTIKDSPMRQVGRRPVRDGRRVYVLPPCVCVWGGGGSHGVLAAHVLRTRCAVTCVGFHLSRQCLSACLYRSPDCCTRLRPRGGPRFSA